MRGHPALVPFWTKTKLKEKLCLIFQFCIIMSMYVSGISFSRSKEFLTVSDKLPQNAVFTIAV